MDPAAFWSSLTPAQSLALLRAAPRVAGAWVDATETHAVEGVTKRLVEFRYTDTAIGILNVGDVWEKPEGDGYAWIANVARDVYSAQATGEAPTQAEARTAADAALRAAGWLLVDDPHPEAER
jgi:hypothetical protein